MNNLIRYNLSQKFKKECDDIFDKISEGFEVPVCSVFEFKHKHSTTLIFTFSGEKIIDYAYDNLLETFFMYDFKSIFQNPKIIQSQFNPKSKIDVSLNDDNLEFYKDYFRSQPQSVEIDKEDSLIYIPAVEISIQFKKNKTL